MTRELTPEQWAAVRAAITRRGQRALTQQQLADAAGVSRRTITGFERGRSWPTTQTLVRIEEALDLPAGALRSLTGQESEGERIRRLERLIDEALAEIAEIRAARARESEQRGA